MSAPAFPNHLLTLAEWDAFPEHEQYRVEVAEGVLAVSPRPLALHQRAARRLANTLEAQLPAVLSAEVEFEVVISESPLTVRAPDVVVLDSAVVASNAARATPEQVRLAIEVHSEGTVRVDRVLKFAEYADAGIPHYWMVDLTPPVSLVAFTHTGRTYESSGEFTGKAELTVADTAVRVDLDSLIAR